MTELLNKAFEAASKLAPAEQDALARDVLARLNSAPRRKRSPGDAQRAFVTARKRLENLPILDTRTPDAILGYGEDGLPR